MAADESHTLISYSIVAALVIGILMMIVYTYYYWDVSIIVNSPWKFLLEIVLLAVIPSLMFFVFVYTRDTPIEKTNVVVLLLMVKLAILHTMLQTSGYYTAIFA